MKNANKQEKLNRFWSGYSYGIITAGIASWLLGTKKGRRFTQRLLNASETIDISLEKLIQFTKEDNKDRIIKTNPNTQEILSKVKGLAK